MIRIDTMRIVWIEHDGERRQYAVPMQDTADQIARAAWCAFTGNVGSFASLPKNTRWALQGVTGHEPLDTRTSALALEEGHTYRIVMSSTKGMVMKP